VTSVGCADYLLKAPAHLAAHIKETVFTIVDAALSQAQGA
jgi:hypothetical protein